MVLLQPRGIFGVPHGVLSSPDEWAALGIGLVALLLVFAYDRLVDGELDLRPVRSAAIAGVGAALLLSALAPPVVTNEWHVPVVVVLGALGAGVLYRRWRARRAERGRRRDRAS